MKVVGEATVRGPVESVWDALHDVVTLAGAIPGCEQFEISGPGLAQVIITIALSAISGTYAAKLTLAEQQRPSLLKLTVAATGDQGSIGADVTLRLSDDADGTTLVNYEANGTVTGSIAGIGTRLLISGAKRLATEFFDGINDRVTVQPDASTASTEAFPAASAAAVGPVAQLRPADESRAPARPVALADRRVALVAGVAIGLAGILVGVLVGRQGRWGRRAGRVRA
jgi:carbon monoxide dehydrogenase subunit G